MRRSVVLLVAVGVVGAVVGLAAACSSGGSGADDVAAPTTTVTTASLPASTTSTTEAVPFDIEVRRAALALLAVRNEVFQAPDVGRVAEYIAPTCTCLERERGFVERFVNEGLHWTAGPITPRGVVIDDPDPTEPALTLVAAQPAVEIVGTDGTSVEFVPAKEVAAYGLTLLRDERGAWRINGLEGIDLNADVVAEIVAAGLP